MMSQNDRLLPLSTETTTLDRPLRELNHPAPIAVQISDSQHLRNYLRIVLKRKWLILSIVVIVTSLVAIQMYRLPSVYEAQAQIQVEQKNRSVLQTRDLVIQAPRDGVYWNTQLKLLESPALARQVILALNLHEDPSFLDTRGGTGIITGIRRIFSGGNRSKETQTSDVSAVPVANDDAGMNPENLTPEQAQRLEPFEDMLRANLTVEAIEKTSLVYIRFQHTKPEVAMRVSNAFAVIFKENDRLRETEGADKANTMLANNIIQLQEEIARDEALRISYMKERGIPLSSKSGGDLNAVRLQTYSSQLQAAEAERKELQASYDSAIMTRNTEDIWSVPLVQSDKRVLDLRTQIEALEKERDALLEQYTPQWPAIKKIDAQLVRLRKNLERAPNEIIAAMKARLGAAMDKERKIYAAYIAERSKATRESTDALGLNDITQRLETNKQLYQTYLQRQRELQVTANDRGQNIAITVPAREPRAPVGPQRTRNIILALLLSLGAGIGLAFLLDYLDDTLKTVEDIDRYLHLPTLALIPAPRAERGLLRGRRAQLPEAGEDPTTALALIENVRSPVAEAYRHLRTSLLLSSAGQPPRTVLVTSSQPSEGKTTTAVNIAMMLAQTGAEVLLLDCDLRRPRIHTHFGTSNARGVTSYLSGESKVDELIQTYDKMPNLKLLASGPVPPNAAELLGSDQMRKLLYLLSEKYQHVVIDSPPVISFTDASILSTMVDGVMLVVHGGRSSRSVAQRAKQQLVDVGAHIFGIVLNNVKAEGSDYYYYTGYYSDYYSGGDDEEEMPEGAETVGAGRGGGPA